MSAEIYNAKQQMISILQQQPEDSSYDELLRELAFGTMIERGLKDVQAGRTLSNEEVRIHVRRTR